MAQVPAFVLPGTLETRGQVVVRSVFSTQTVRGIGLVSTTSAVTLVRARVDSMQSATSATTHPSASACKATPATLLHLVDPLSLNTVSLYAMHALCFASCFYSLFHNPNYTIFFNVFLTHLIKYLTHTININQLYSNLRVLKHLHKAQ